MQTKFYIIVNEAAGGGKVRQEWPKIKTELNTLTINYQFQKTIYSGHAIKLAYDLCASIKSNDKKQAIILAIGGDGTLHETLTGAKNYFAAHLKESPIPIAYLSIGSGNDFARAAGLSLNWKTALHQILDCQQANPISIASFNNHQDNESGYFVNNFGIGFDATIVSKANHSKIKKHPFLGQFSYIFAILGVLTSFKAFPLKLTTNDQTITYPKAFLVTTSNHPYFGGGVKILPQASIFKSNLELIIVEKPSLFQLILFLIMLPLGKHLKLKFVHHLVSDQFRLTTNTAQFGQIDGEETGDRVFDISFGVTTYPFWLK
ncbi:diacylglycerol kinase family lipid kinase [Lentilactobacillus senioris]|uniref:diacylglycerol/lipid kinase family protein n=1 Tax=Lentilactobacillus senioris TaxID=931534 RepID=UPI00227FDD00|nr:diacylglycerol kinase family protein [Lentilactobacillus senioris]MCY9807633.1 diacylglycerol kinase family lipid kinase [Lentilactobacillus senioris]